MLLITEGLKVGSVLKVYYFNVLGRKRKIFIFTGICKKFNKSSKTATLENSKGKELIWMNFLLNSPYVVAMQELTSYNFKKFTKASLVRGLAGRTFSFSGLGEMAAVTIVKAASLDPYDYIYASAVRLPERQRLRRKFRI